MATSLAVQSPVDTGLHGNHSLCIRVLCFILRPRSLSSLLGSYMGPSLTQLWDLTCGCQSSLSPSPRGEGFGWVGLPQSPARVPGKDKGGSCLVELMLLPIFPDSVGTLSLMSDTYKGEDLEPFLPCFSCDSTSSPRNRSRTGPLVKSRLLLYPGMWPPALQGGRGAPRTVLALLSLVCCGNLPPEPWLPQSRSGAESPWAAGRAVGGFWGRAAFPNALLPLWYRGHFLKVLVPSNILCREGGKIYSGNYFPTVW